MAMAPPIVVPALAPMTMVITAIPVLVLLANPFLLRPRRRAERLAEIGSAAGTQMGLTAITTMMTMTTTMKMIMIMAITMMAITMATLCLPKMGRQIPPIG